MSISCQPAYNVKRSPNLSNSARTYIAWRGREGNNVLERLAACIAVADLDVAQTR